MPPVAESIELPFRLCSDHGADAGLDEAVFAHRVPACEVSKSQTTQSWSLSSVTFRLTSVQNMKAIRTDFTRSRQDLSL